MLQLRLAHGGTAANAALLGQLVKFRSGRRRFVAVLPRLGGRGGDVAGLPGELPALRRVGALLGRSALVILVGERLGAPFWAGNARRCRRSWRRTSCPSPRPAIAAGRCRATSRPRTRHHPSCIPARRSAPFAPTTGRACRPCPPPSPPPSPSPRAWDRSSPRSGPWMPPGRLPCGKPGSSGLVPGVICVMPRSAVDALISS